MKRSSSLLLVSSVLWLAIAAIAEQRPHYGGTLRLTIKQAPGGPGPAALAPSGCSSIAPLIFETLTRLDHQGRPQPLLATSWNAEPGNQRWRISLRTGVSFHDGVPLDAAAVTASLRTSNPDWKIFLMEEMVIIETPSPEPDLPAKLASTGNAIVHPDGDALSGTGPFSIGDWTAGKHLTLVANDQYWAGRPYLDSIEISFGLSDPEQMLALDLGKADVVEIAPENIRRAQLLGRAVVSSEPTELIALQFNSDQPSDDDLHSREALSASLDKYSLADVVLQGGAEPASGLLPQWLSGYEFAFAPAGKTALPQRDRAPARRPTSWTLTYDSSDPVARTLAERVLLNARDAGVRLQLITSGSADLHLVSVPCVPSDPKLALTEVAKTLQLATPSFAGNSIEELYTVEKNLLDQHRVIPLMHVRRAFAFDGKVRELKLAPDGTLRLDNVWLAAEKP